MKKQFLVTGFLAGTFFANAQWSGTNPELMSGNARVGGTNAPNQTFHVGDGTGSLHNGQAQGMIIKFAPGTSDRALLELHSPDGANRTYLQSLSGATYFGSIDNKPFYLNGGTGPVTIGEDVDGLNKLEVRTSSINDGIRITQRSSGSGAAALYLNNETSGGRRWSVLSTGNGSSQGAGHFSIFDNTANMDRFLIKSNGYVGIGNSNPVFKLDVLAGAGPDGIQISQPGAQYNDYAVLYLNHTNGGKNWAISSAPNGNFGLLNYTTGNWTMIAHGTTGNVGIGLNTNGQILGPATKLEVSSGVTDDGILVTQTGSSRASLYLKQWSAGKQWAFQADAAGSLMIKDVLAAADRLSVNNAGNVGINNTTPSEKLDVTGNVKFSGALMPNNAAGTAGQVLVSAGPNQPPAWSNVNGSLAGGATNYLSKWSGTSSLTSSLIYDNGTNVGIGTNNPGSKLEVRDASYSKIAAYTTSVNKAGLWALNGTNSYGLIVDGSGVGHLVNNINGPEFNLINFQQSNSAPQVWIGNSKPQSPHTDFQFAVAGKVLAQSIYVTPASQWADYVFAPEYKLAKLTDVEKFYQENKHLPEIPSAKEVEEKGIDVGEMNTLLLKKVEELTLYVVDLNKKIESLEAENKKKKL